MGFTESGMPENWKNFVEITASSDDDVARARLRDEFDLEIDEPEWVDIGYGSAPWPALYLLVATAGCQVEVLRQCFAKARIEEYDIHMYVEFSSDDVEHGPGGAPEPFPENTGLRYNQIRMELDVTTTSEYETRVQRCLDVAEDACNVSRSVEDGIDIGLKKRLDVVD